MFQKNPRLTYWKVEPKTVSRTTLVKSPDAFITGRGKTGLLCGLGEAGMLIDFREEVVGGLEIRISCRAAAHVEVIYEEEPDGAMRREPFCCSWYRQPKDEYELEAGEHTLISKGRRGFRYIGLFVTSTENAELISAEATNGGWPVEERGSFRCSDERLNKIWDISRATVRACMQDFHEDGVKRDGLLWIGDYRLAFMAGWCAFGEKELARRSLDLAVENLKNQIVSNLRQGDVVTQCSASQLIAMLPQANYENSCMVAERLLKSFNRQYPHSPVSVSFSVQPLEPLEMSREKN